MTDVSIRALCDLIELVEKLRYENCHIKQHLKEKAIKAIDARIEEVLEKSLADNLQKMTAAEAAADILKLNAKLNRDYHPNNELNIDEIKRNHK